MTMNLEQLNESQREAVLAPDGPLLIFAGAGSGKTAVLTHRIAHLILERGFPASAIFAATFTNKAAGEMRERIRQLVGEEAEYIWMGTFHSQCAKMLRMDGERIGIPREFSIYDDGDQMALMKEVVATLNLDEKKCSPRAMLSMISRAKERLWTPAENYAKAYGYFEESAAKCYDHYQQKLQAANALDFDDLIFFAVKLLREDQGTREKYVNKFAHVLVDEFQDVNRAQYEFTRLLAGRGNVCVVGDDDQSIYGWRGADVQIILDFEKDFPNARIVKLERNYRSTKTILDAAWNVVKQNKSRAEKRLYTEKGHGHKVRVVACDDEREEARYLIEQIENLEREGLRKTEIAVLYRMNAQSRVFEEELLKEAIPYRIIGGLRFYERKEIKDILAYLRLVVNPSDNLALMRAIAVPSRGIGDKTLQLTAETAAAQGCSLLDALTELAERKAYTPKINSAALSFCKMVKTWRMQSANEGVADFARRVLTESGYLAMLQSEKTDEAQERLENLEEFINVAKEFEEEAEENTLLDFLERTALVTDIDMLDESLDAVRLMTLHSAKGLEFNTVFMVGMEQGVFPHSRALYDEKEMEEERRLAYVGITRAKERLYLTWAKRRMMWGSIQTGLPSRFLDDIPAELTCDAEGAERSPDEMIRAAQKRADVLWREHPAFRRAARTESAPTYKTGARVRHPQFGPGIVIASKKLDADEQVTVAFEGNGVKKLLLSFAKLERL
jgi:DNA helicase-2/ATP-dependent DNA helicase PcrA